LLAQFGTRSTFTAIGLLSAVSTAFIPLASEFGLSLFVVCRFGQGMAFIGCFPVIGTIVTNWASLKQNAISLAICTSFLQIAPSITNPLASALCLSSAGWPAVYYIHAAMTFVLFALFAVFYRNHPGKHPLVGARELTRIATGKSAIVTKKATTAVPYAAIMRTATVWAVWVAAVGAFFSTNLVLLYAPTYLNKVMKFPVSLTGVSSALPPFVQFIVKLISGLLSDKLSCIRERYKIRIWNTMALCGQAAFFVALSFVPDSQPILALVLLICAQSSLGFNTGGFYKVSKILDKN
jgi:sugar phosphate permease